MAKAGKKSEKSDVRLEVLPPSPSLDEHCRDLNNLYIKVMTGEVPAEKARAALGIKKQEMKRFDYGIQIARMLPVVRPALAQLLGLPEPGTDKPGVAAK